MMSAGIGHNQVPSLNKNIEALAQGMAFRLEITAAGNAGRVGHEFTKTKAEAQRRRRDLREAGFVGTVFQITSSGGLRP